MTRRDALRIRRYLDDVLVDERELTGTAMLGEGDAEWATMAVEAGARFRIVIDDPAGDVPTVVVLEGGPA